MKYKLFKNLYFKKVYGGYSGVYNPLKDHKIIFLETKLADSLLKFKEGGSIEDFPELSSHLELLLEHKFLLPEDFNQAIPVLNVAKNIPAKPRISLMYLVLSEQCNFGCDYCFLQGNFPADAKPRFMSESVCDKAIDFFCRVADRESDHKVIFYGGEPLLNKKVFRRAVTTLRALESDRKLSNLGIIVNTNGSQIDDDLAQFAKKNDVNLAISIDGREKEHDSVRKTISKEGTFRETVRGYRTAQKYGVRPGISCTVTNQNIGMLEEIVHYFINELDPNGIGFNFLLDFKDKKNPSSVSVGEATKMVLKAFEILRAAGIYEDRIMRRLGKMVKGEIHLKDCAGYGHQVVVFPDGKIGPCQVFLSCNQYVAGSIDNPPNPSDNPIFLEWNKRTAFCMEGCEDCSFISLCGGGCAYESFLAQGSIWKKDERICEHTQCLVDWVIDDLWKAKQKELKLQNASNQFTGTSIP